VTKARNPGALLALIAVATTAIGIALLPVGSAAAAAGFHQAGQKHRVTSATTVTGPRMWIPNATGGGQLSRRRSTVTVSQTTNLTNQMVSVSWTGFAPSSSVIYDPASTNYPVMVAECDSPKVTSWSQCYGANNGGVEGAFGAYGPMNTAYATTAANGRGALDIQIMVANQNQLLGCGVRHECSLVIVPSQGGNTLSSPAVCSDHSADFGGTAEGQFAFSRQTGQCSWADRIVVPLSFVPAPTDCPIGSASFAALGSPMLDRAMEQWLAALCAKRDPLTITYNPAITEPEAVADLPTGLGDVALTSRPGPTVIGSRHYAYAPLAISAVSIAYWVDNPLTGQPVKTLRLDPRLVAKLITQSYNFQNEGCGQGAAPPKIGCDNAVDGNPISLFADREFTSLNPQVKTPVGYGGSFQIPTVESGHSDMTWQVTRWIADNAPASSFMAGKFDPWGMHVNTDYMGLQYPIDTFTGQDNYPVIAHKYSPDFPLNSVDQLQAQNRDNGTDWETDDTGNFPKDPVEVPGERALFAIMDEGSAAAFKFPVAEILNDRGRYVAPTASSMAAALRSMVATGGNNVTKRVDFAKQEAGAYPLTMVIYAMVPTSSTSTKKAAAIARFLDYVAGPGQRRGLAVGELPPGFVPLTAPMRAQTRHAALLVARQAGGHQNTHPSPSSPTATSSPTDPPSTSGQAPTPRPTPTASASPRPHVKVVTVALKSAPAAGVLRYALPALLVVGGLATLGGASTLIAGSASAGVTERLRRISRLRRLSRRKP
jgi:hypothetical protein